MTTYSALTSNESQDPYPSWKASTQNSVNNMMSDYSTWNDMLHSTNTAQNTDFRSLTDSLKKHYKLTKSELKEGQKAIVNIEQNREMFSNIRDEELQNRKKFLKDMRVCIDDCKNGMQSPGSKRIIAKHRRAVAAVAQQSVAESESPFVRASRVKNDEFIGDHKQQQVFERREQDDALDDMLVTLKRLGVHGHQINVELEQQADELKEVNEEMEVAMGRIERLTKKMDDMMANSETKKIILIVLLVVILGVMIYFMF